MNRRKKLIIAGLAAGAVIVLAAVAVGMKKAGKPSGMMPGGVGKGEASMTVVQAEQPSIGGISVSTNLTGTVEPADVVHIYAKAAGDVTAVHVKAGDTVAQGQILLEIDTQQVESAQNSLESAAVSLSEAQSNLARIQILYSGGDLSAQEYEQYVNAVKSAQLKYDSAKLDYERQVEYSSVSSPISGRIESFDAEMYDHVTQSQDLCVVSGAGEKVVSFYVTHRMMENLTVGDELVVEKNGSEYSAYITEINSMVDTETGLFKVKAQVESTDEIAAGSTVKLRLVTQKAENAMLIPIDAVYYSGGQSYVYLYQEGISVMVPVELGMEDQEKAQVLSGVSAEDLVISTWSSNLYEGAKVKLKDVKDESEAEGQKQTEGQKKIEGQKQAGEQERAEGQKQAAEQEE